MNPNYVANLVNLISALPTGLDTKQQLIGLLTPTPTPTQFPSQFVPQSVMGNEIQTQQTTYTSNTMRQTQSITSSIASLSDSTQTQTQTNEYREINVNQDDNNKNNTCTITNESVTSALSETRKMSLNARGTQENTITSSTINNPNIYTPECQSPVEKCQSIKRIVKFALFRSRYSHVDIAKLFKNFNADYRHYMTYHSINSDKLKIDQISKQFEQIYCFIINFNKNTKKFNNPNAITLKEIEYLNNTMDKIYDGMQGMQSNSACAAGLNSIKIEMIDHDYDTPNLNVMPAMLPMPAMPAMPAMSAMQPMPTMCPIPATPTHCMPPSTTCGAKNAESSNNALKLPTYNPLMPNNYRPSSLPKLHAIPPQHTGSLFKNPPKPVVKNMHKVLDFSLKIVPKKNVNRVFVKEPDDNVQIARRELYNPHLKIHNGYINNIYKCSFCDKQFRLRHVYVDHLRYHNGVKPYGCTRCKKLFKQKSELNSHIKRGHNENQKENEHANNDK